MEKRIVKIPFGSDKFVFDEENFGAAIHEVEELMIARLRKINQLQRLTHPSQVRESGYLWFPFPQTRFDHSILILPVAKKILEEAGFSKHFIKKFLLAALTHDIATPAGGDATMRLNKAFFCEVRNYKRYLIESGLSSKWNLSFGFDDEEAEQWVGDNGMIGFLLNVLDKWSYTALDSFHLGENRPPEILKLLKKFPLVMDVWKDIYVSKETVYFSNASRLRHFILLWALMHSEFYLNPACRKLEHLFFCETKKLFNSGEISVDDLRYRDDHWLESAVRCGKESSWCTQPESVSWNRFDDEESVIAFQKSNKSVFHIERIKPFETGINWRVMQKGKIMPLAEALQTKFVEEIEKISQKQVGWYAYCNN